jgi:hypothetical protein
VKHQPSWKIILVYLLLLLPCLLSGYADEDEGGDVWLLFLLDYDDFLCMSCLESFLRFCDSLPDQFLEKRCFGILMTQEENDLKNSGIIRKKMKCFVIANDIKFPIFYDRSGGHGFEIGESAVVLMDFKNQVTKKFMFPIGLTQSREISAVLPERLE